MERSGKREGLLEKTAEVFDLPGDVVAGLPRIELTGSRESNPVVPMAAARRIVRS